MLPEAEEIAKEIEEDKKTLFYPFFNKIYNGGRTPHKRERLHNMKIMPCEACGKETAQNAKTCPHCGMKLYRTSPLTKIVGFLLAIGLFLFIAGLFASLR